MENKEIVQIVQSRLQEVYDPEFPIVDIRTLWLIYDIKADQKKNIIHILMTFTSPSCPSIDEIQTQVTNSINQELPQYTVQVEVTRDPLRTLQNIKDPDLLRMFE